MWIKEVEFNERHSEEKSKQTLAEVVSLFTLCVKMSLLERHFVYIIVGPEITYCLGDVVEGIVKHLAWY